MYPTFDSSLRNLAEDPLNSEDMLLIKEDVRIKDNPGSATRDDASDDAYARTSSRPDSKL
jgi:hypothetical protein